MQPSKWRISKACHECRARKIRCNGNQPCERCQERGVACAYREKARHRLRANERAALAQSASGVASTKNADSLVGVAAAATVGTASSSSPGHGGQSSNNISIHSVAATHEASPSCFVQLYYGPSSIFSLLHSIYHQIEGTAPNSPSHEGVEEVGPGLDLFSHRRLFFGDLAGGQTQHSRPDDCTSILLDPSTAHRFMERYLETHWHALPVPSKTEYRRDLSTLYGGSMLFKYDSPSNIILTLALALGASSFGEHAVSEFLYEKARQGSMKLEEVVNVQMVHNTQLQMERARPNSGFLHMGTAVRRAVATGMHKEAGFRAGETKDKMSQRRTIFWSLFFWETWICFTNGRPSSLPDPGNSIPIPSDQKLLQSLVALSRIMLKCYSNIYNTHRPSLLPLWNAANEIRGELHDFAEKQPSHVGFELTGNIMSGEIGLCQAIISSVYHHTLHLTFRPFLILRAKLRQDNFFEATDGSGARPGPPVWFDQACNYCIEAARSAITFLEQCCRENILCKEVRYHNFFIEGACYVLALDMLQEPDGARQNLPWINKGLKALRTMIPESSSDGIQPPVTIAAIIRMVRTVIPDFQEGSDAVQDERGDVAPKDVPQAPSGLPVTGPGLDGSNLSNFFSPSMPPSLGGSYPSHPIAVPVPHTGPQEDFTAADLGWDIDFGSLDMDAFLSIDANQNWMYSQ